MSQYPKSLARRKAVQSELSSLCEDRARYLRISRTVAAELAVTTQSVREVITGRSSSERILQAIRRHLTKSRVKQAKPTSPEHLYLAERVRRAGFRMIGAEEEKLIRIGRAFLAKTRAEKILAEVSL